MCERFLSKGTNDFMVKQFSLKTKDHYSRVVSKVDCNFCKQNIVSEGTRSFLKECCVLCIEYCTFLTGMLYEKHMLHIVQECRLFRGILDHSSKTG